MASRTVVLAVNPDIIPEVAGLLAGALCISEPIGGKEGMRVHEVGTSAFPIRVPLFQPTLPKVDLPPRVLQTLQMLADGLSVKQIASRMGIAVASAKTHTARLYRLLGVNGAPAAVAEGFRLGLLTGGES